MKYRVIKSFSDAQDNKHKYNAGDSFPRVGLTVSDERIAELSGPDNRQGVPLIEKIQSKPRKKKQ